MRETERPVPAKKRAVHIGIAMPGWDDRCYATFTSMVLGLVFSDASFTESLLSDVLDFLQTPLPLHMKRE